MEAAVQKVHGEAEVAQRLCLQDQAGYVPGEVGIEFIECLDRHLKVPERRRSSRSGGRENCVNEVIEREALGCQLSGQVWARG